MADNTKNKEIIVREYNKRLVEIKYDYEKYKHLEKQINKLQEISSATSAKALQNDNKEQKIWDENDPVYKILTAIVKERATKGAINMDDEGKLKDIQAKKIIDLATKINNNVDVVNEIHDFLKDDLGIQKDNTVIEWEQKGIETPKKVEKKNLMVDIGKNMWEITKIIDGGITTKDREVLTQKLEENNVSIELSEPKQGKNINDDIEKNNEKQIMSNGQM